MRGDASSASTSCTPRACVHCCYSKGVRRRLVVGCAASGAGWGCGHVAARSLCVRVCAVWRAASGRIHMHAHSIIARARKRATWRTGMSAPVPVPTSSTRDSGPSPGTAATISLSRCARCSRGRVMCGCAGVCEHVTRVAAEDCAIPGKALWPGRRCAERRRRRAARADTPRPRARTFCTASGSGCWNAATSASNSAAWRALCAARSAVGSACAACCEGGGAVCVARASHPQLHDTEGVSVTQGGGDRSCTSAGAGAAP